METKLSILNNLLFLEKLFLHRRLVFVGDEELVSLLKDKYSRSRVKKINYLLSTYPLFLTEESFYKRFSKHKRAKFQAIAVSLTDEDALSERLKQFSGERLDMLPVIRFFNDIYVNFHCKRKLVGASSPALSLPDLAYGIICTPRSGSDYLCELLENTGLAGYPREYLNGTTEFLVENGNFSGRDYLINLQGSAVTRNKVFGIKVISHYLQSHISWEDYSDIFRKFKFIYLYREKKTAQAVSLYLARETRLWHSRSSQKMKEYAAALASMVGEDSIDYEKIRKMHRLVINQEKLLKNFLDKDNLDFMMLKYEDLSREPEKSLRKVMQFLGIELPADYRLKKARNIKLRSSDTKVIIERAERFLSGS